MTTMVACPRCNTGTMLPDGADMACAQCAYRVYGDELKRPRRPEIEVAILRYVGDRANISRDTRVRLVNTPDMENFNRSVLSVKACPFNCGERMEKVPERDQHDGGGVRFYCPDGHRITAFLWKYGKQKGWA